METFKAFTVCILLLAASGTAIVFGGAAGIAVVFILWFFVAYSIGSK